ncbi:MAG: iron chelate uptake ABC transporter family permease subunit, partial [bacterium]
MSTRVSGRGARTSAARLQTVELGPIAFRVDLRVLALIGIALLIYLAMGAWALTLGSYPISLAEVVSTLLGSGTGRSEFIIFGLRLPRIVAAGLAGLMLAMSGAIFQGLVRNPLVSPDIIGINSGAALVAVF